MRRMILTLIIVLIGMAGFADAAVVTGFEQMGDFSGLNGLLQDLRMDTDWTTYAVNLRVEIVGIEMSLAESDMDTGTWHLGLKNEHGYIAGFANNNNDLANTEPSARGFLQGKYSGSAILGTDGNPVGFASGQKPFGAYLVYDALDNGWDIVDGVLGSQGDLNQGDIFFDDSMIRFDGILSDLSAFDAFDTDDHARIPEMTAVIVPEPMTITLLGLGSLLILKTKTGRKT